MTTLNLDVNRVTGNLDYVECKDFTVVGENHPCEAHADLLLHLMRTNEFSDLYLEALPTGQVKEGYKEKLRERGVILSRTVDGVFARPGENVFVYDYNPEKYDRIIDGALNRGINVHGIDVKPKSMRPPQELSQWAGYICSTRKRSSLILVGNVHALYKQPPHSEIIKKGCIPWGYANTPEEAKLESLSSRLIEMGVPKSDIVVIANPNLEIIKGVREGLFGIGSTIPLDSSYSPFSRSIMDLIYKEVDRGRLEGKGNIPGFYEECVQNVKSRLSYSDEESYIQWLKRQCVIGDPVLDIFFFHPRNSEPVPRVK